MVLTGNTIRRVTKKAIPNRLSTGSNGFSFFSNNSAENYSFQIPPTFRFFNYHKIQQND